MLSVVLTALMGSGELSVGERMAGRNLPSVFQAWNKVEGVEGDEESLMAKHDLFFGGLSQFRLLPEGKWEGEMVALQRESVVGGLALRERLLKKNPNMVLLVEMRYRDAGSWFLPEDHKFWKRDDLGKRVPGWEEGGYFLLDFGSSAYRDMVAMQCKLVCDTGVVDGVMLDWWAEDAERIALVKAVREAIGPDKLILVNANHNKVPGSAAYVNGLFMECYSSGEEKDWVAIEETLRWAEANLREPRINCLETWFDQSRGDLAKMRATTALSLCLSNGYVLFSDPNPLPTPDHLHDWYQFWDRGLGVGAALKVDRPGTYMRRFSGGYAVYNRKGNPGWQISFDQAMRARSSGKSGTSFVVAGGDGEIFLYE